VRTVRRKRAGVLAHVFLRRYLAPVHALPFLLSVVLAALVTPPLLAVLRRAGWTAPNYRGRRLPRPTGLVLAAGAPLTVAVLALAERGSGEDLLPPGAVEAVAFVSGVALLGLLDDVLGTGAEYPRGVRAHLAHTLGGRPSTGAIKALATAGLALALVAAPGSALAGPSFGDSATAVATLTLAPHVFNLLDLRPGRALKAFAVLGAGLALGARDLDVAARLGVLLGPVLVLLPLDVRERGMLGDAGASAVGAIAGLWLELALPSVGAALAVLALAAVAVYGELRSITALVERNPLLRQLDSLGRCG